MNTEYETGGGRSMAFESTSRGPPEKLRAECPFCKQRVSVSVPKTENGCSLLVRACNRTLPDVHTHEIEIVEYAKRVDLPSETRKAS